MLKFFEFILQVFFLVLLCILIIYYFYICANNKKCPLTSIIIAKESLLKKLKYPLILCKKKFFLLRLFELFYYAIKMRKYLFMLDLLDNNKWVMPKDLNALKNMI